MHFSIHYHPDAVTAANHLPLHLCNADVTTPCSKKTKDRWFVHGFLQLLPIVLGIMLYKAVNSFLFEGDFIFLGLIGSCIIIKKLSKHYPEAPINTVSKSNG